MMKIRLFPLAVALAFIGCAEMVTPKPAVLAAADYGAYPSNYQAIVQGWIKDSFKDPYSIRDLKVGVPQKYWIQDPPLLGGKTHYGYMVAVALNAKNAFGAYVGIHAFIVLIRNGRPIAQQNVSEVSAIGPQWIDL